MFKELLKNFGLNDKNNRFEGRTILVVEDNEIDRKVIVNVLEKQGAHVLLAGTGEEGLQNAKAEGLDCIILDLNLPDIEGSEVCKQLKNNEKTLAIPVIFLTAESGPKSVISCYDVGADYFLTKPINAKALVKQVKMILDEREGCA